MIPGIMTYDDDCNVRIENNSYPYTGGRKLFLEEQLIIARLGCMRIWNLKQKLVDHEKDNV